MHIMRQWSQDPSPEGLYPDMSSALALAIATRFAIADPIRGLTASGISASTLAPPDSTNSWFSTQSASQAPWYAGTLSRQPSAMPHGNSHCPSRTRLSTLLGTTRSSPPPQPECTGMTRVFWPAAVGLMKLYSSTKMWLMSRLPAPVGPPGQVWPIASLPSCPCHRFRKKWNWKPKDQLHPARAVGSARRAELAIRPLASRSPLPNAVATARFQDADSCACLPRVSPKISRLLLLPSE